jgi:hypothetical protein
LGIESKVQRAHETDEITQALLRQRIEVRDQLRREEQLSSGIKCTRELI